MWSVSWRGRASSDSTHRQPRRSGHVKMRKHIEVVGSREHAVMGGYTVLMLVWCHCSWAFKKLSTPVFFFFSSRPGSRASANIIQPLISLTASLRQYLAAAALLNSGLVVLVEEKLQLKCCFCVNYNLGEKNTSNKHLIFDRCGLNQSHSMSDPFSRFGKLLYGRKGGKRISDLPELWLICSWHGHQT